MSEEQKSKREFIKKAAYVVPAILTLAAAPSFASKGSGRDDRDDEDEDENEDEDD